MNTVTARKWKKIFAESEPEKPKTLAEVSNIWYKGMMAATGIIMTADTTA